MNMAPQCPLLARDGYTRITDLLYTIMPDRVAHFKRKMPNCVERALLECGRLFSGTA
jgi:hypothetical protein